MRMRFAALNALAAAVILAPSAFAFEESGPASSEALTESAEAVAALAEAGVKVTSGVVAVPIYSAGAGSAAIGSVVETVGALSGAVGEETAEAGVAAWDFANVPLNVDDDTIVSQPAPRVPFTPGAEIED